MGSNVDKAGKYHDPAAGDLWKIMRLQSGRMLMISDGQNITDLTYVENVVDSLLGKNIP